MIHADGAGGPDIIASLCVVLLGACDVLQSSDCSVLPFMHCVLSCGAGDVLAALKAFRRSVGLCKDNPLLRWPNVALRDFQALAQRIGPVASEEEVGVGGSMEDVEDDAEYMGI